MVCTTDCQSPYIDDLAICYQDKLLIDLTRNKKHEDHWKQGTMKTMSIRHPLDSRKVTVVSLKDWLRRIYHHWGWDRHAISAHINHQGPAYSLVNPRCTSAYRHHKLQLTIGPPICVGNTTSFQLTNKIKPKIGLDQKSRAYISETEERTYWSTNPTAFWPGKDYHPSDGHNWLCNRRYP